jgi:Xaa-Pro aminopeptidase
MEKSFANRRRALRRLIGREKLDRLLLTDPADWYYLTGFTGDSGCVRDLARSREGRLA